MQPWGLAWIRSRGFFAATAGLAGRSWAAFGLAALLTVNCCQAFVVSRIRAFPWDKLEESLALRAALQLRQRMLDRPALVLVTDYPPDLDEIFFFPELYRISPASINLVKIFPVQRNMLEEWSSVTSRQAWRVRARTSGWIVPNDSPVPPAAQQIAAERNSIVMVKASLETWWSNSVASSGAVRGKRRCVFRTDRGDPIVILWVPASLSGLCR